MPKRNRSSFEEPEVDRRDATDVAASALVTLSHGANTMPILWVTVMMISFGPLGESNQERELPAIVNRNQQVEDEIDRVGKHLMNKIMTGGSPPRVEANKLSLNELLIVQKYIIRVLKRIDDRMKAIDM